MPAQTALGFAAISARRRRANDKIHKSRMNRSELGNLMTSPPPLDAPPISELPARRPWSLWDVLLVALVIFISLNIFVFIAAIIAISLHADGLSFARVSSDRQAVNVLVQDVRINVPAQAAAYLIGILSMVMIAHSRYRERFGEAIRWRWPQLHWF